MACRVQAEVFQNLLLAILGAITPTACACKSYYGLPQMGIRLTNPCLHKSCSGVINCLCSHLLGLRSWEIAPRKVSQQIVPQLWCVHHITWTARPFCVVWWAIIILLLADATTPAAAPAPELTHSQRCRNVPQCAPIVCQRCRNDPHCAPIVCQRCSYHHTVTQ